jgi:hypothetical protein
VEALCKRSGNLPGRFRDRIAFRLRRDAPKMAGQSLWVPVMRLFLLPMLAACLWFAPSVAKAEDSGPKQGTAIAVIDFDYVDTSGEARDQRKEHEVRLEAFMRGLRDDLGKRGGFRIATPACTPNPCSLEGSAVGDVLAAAREAGADIMLIGGVHKMSTLVQWAKVQAIETRTQRVMFDKLFTFRGDTDDAWRRAEAFIADEIAAVSAQPVAPSPIRIAVFDFELDDLSGGAGIAGDPAADLAQMHRVTDDVRQLIAQSGRYGLVDVASAESEAVKARTLRQCDGCEAAIASKLGADQSLVGVVTRISRTEYVVRFQIRDSRTGTLVLARQSDLRIGADYSWNRGAAALIRNSLLDNP